MDTHLSPSLCLHVLLLDFEQVITLTLLLDFEQVIALTLLLDFEQVAERRKGMAG